MPAPPDRAGPPADAPEWAAPLRHAVGRGAPGLQYLRVDAAGPRREFHGGLADVAAGHPVDAATPFMTCSITKTFTAVVLLQLAERGALALDDRLDDHLPDTPYAGAGITLRQLLTHTAGLPNPIPLRWAHPVEAHAGFNEAAALRRVLRRHPRLAHRPGRRFAYSNVGYWLLGAVVERVAGRPFTQVMREGVLEPLGLSPAELGFTHVDPARAAAGYLPRGSLLDLLKPFLVERSAWSGYEGRWLRFRHHYLDGPAFGGLIGTARALGRFLSDQLAPASLLLGADSRRLLATPQRTAVGAPIPMTPGWHVRATPAGPCLYKEGGGAGFHGEMRLYPERGVGTVLLGNGVSLDVRGLLDRVDGVRGE